MTKNLNKHEFQNLKISNMSKLQNKTAQVLMRFKSISATNLKVAEVAPCHASPFGSNIPFLFLASCATKYLCFQFLQHRGSTHGLPSRQLHVEVSRLLSNTADVPLSASLTAPACLDAPVSVLRLSPSNCLSRGTSDWTLLLYRPLSATGLPDASSR